jgi:hypothetical protein
MRTPIIKPVFSIIFVLIVTLLAAAPTVPADNGDNQQAIILNTGQEAPRAGVLLGEPLFREYVKAYDLKTEYTRLIEVLDRKLLTYSELEILWQKELSNYKDLLGFKEGEVELLKTELTLETERRDKLDAVITRNRFITSLCICISAGIVSGVAASAAVQ